MPYDKNGNPAHSFGHARRQEESHANMQSASKVVNPKSRPEHHQPDPDAEMKDESPEDIHDVVDEHGPAHEVHVKSDHENGEADPGKEGHDGFVHHSKHGSVHEAHKHMAKALGMSEHEKGESPEYESGEESKMTAAIPGMD
jgi:hypothetical protein